MNNLPLNVALLIVVFAGASMAPDAWSAKHAKSAAKKPQTQAQTLNVDTVNSAGTQPMKTTTSRAALLRAQILLDRAHFSTGEIDASSGSNLKKSVAAFQQQNGLTPSGVLDQPTWELLNRDSAPVLVEYALTSADVAGPFLPIPKKMEEKASLPALGFTSSLEGLGERFHVSPKLLQQLNPRKNLAREGEVLVVPAVEAAALPKGAKVVVSKKLSTVTLLDASGNILAHFPASVGSEHDPLPLGTWKIKGVAKNPVFHYNPKLFWDADPADKKAKIPAGPNNPVGVVWIDLSKDHYGIHGTPEPSTIGKTQSHGCIRLTNWDAALLAQAVSPGMTAILEE